MSSVIITLRLPNDDSMDLELPSQVPITELLPALLEALKLPVADPRRGVSYQLSWLRSGQQHPLRGRTTLAYAGVATGDILMLNSNFPQGLGVQQGRAQGGYARLRTESGTVIALDNFGRKELKLGRYDARSGKMPDIDLTEEPSGNTVSRTHALLRKQGEQWWLVPLSDRSTTCVRNIPIQEPRALKSGDVIALGAVTMVFEMG